MAQRRDVTDAASLRDDTRWSFGRPPAVRRVVSLVPSLTEAIAAGAPGLLVGATDWCSHPAALDVARVGGTKNPSIAQVLDLGPDVVVANAEENRPADLAELRAQGVAVWTTAPMTLDAALVSLHRMLVHGLGLERPPWLDDAAAVWDRPAPERELTAVTPVWRKPWMFLGRNTFASDLLARLGVRNVLGETVDRYPKLSLDELPPYDVVVLPDEPYAFTAGDGPEAFDVPAVHVSGRHLTWYGPSLVEARDVLSRALDEAVRYL